MPTPPATVLVITVSDRSSDGDREDASGPRLVELLKGAGYDVRGPVVIPDGADSVESALRDGVASGVRLIVTTGGTGIAPRDFTPEGTRAVITRDMESVAEHLRRHGEQYTPLAVLSRGVVGVVDPGPDSPADTIGTLIVNFPGSLKAVDQSMEALTPLLPHLLDMVIGWDH